MEDDTLTEFASLIDRNRRRIALVVDGDRNLISAIPDGDIRRAILDNVSLDEPVCRLLDQMAVRKNGQPITTRKDWPTTL